MAFERTAGKRYRKVPPQFNRSLGEFVGHPFGVEGELLDDATFQRKIADWLPSDEDKAYVKSLMVQVTEPGKFAGWIAPPLRGINSQPIECEYVKL